MAGAIICELDLTQFSLALSAAEWVRGFYPDITVTVARDVALLASDQRDKSGLRLIWQTSLANERLFDAGRGRRAALLAELVE